MCNILMLTDFIQLSIGFEREKCILKHLLILGMVYGHIRAYKP